MSNSLHSKVDLTLNGGHSISFEEKEILIGSGLNCDIVVKDESCPRYFLLLKFNLGNLEIVALDPSHGFTVNGCGFSKILNENDELEIFDEIIKVEAISRPQYVEDFDVQLTVSNEDATAFFDMEETFVNVSLSPSILDINQENIEFKETDGSAEISASSDSNKYLNVHIYFMGQLLEEHHCVYQNQTLITMGDQADYDFQSNYINAEVDISFHDDLLENTVYLNNVTIFYFISDSPCQISQKFMTQDLKSQATKTAATCLMLLLMFVVHKSFLPEKEEVIQEKRIVLYTQNPEMKQEAMTTPEPAAASKEVEKVVKKPVKKEVKKVAKVQKKKKINPFAKLAAKSLKVQKQDSSKDSSIDFKSDFKAFAKKNGKNKLVNRGKLATKMVKGRSIANSKNIFEKENLKVVKVARGSIDPEVLRKLLAEYLPQFKHCYQQELNSENDTLQGNLSLNFRINGNGKVSNVSIAGKTQSLSKTGQNCMVTVLNVIPFPKPKGGGKVDVRQPLNFSSEKTKT